MKKIIIIIFFLSIPFYAFSQNYDVERIKLFSDWIVKNEHRKGTEDFRTVSEALMEILSITSETKKLSNWIYILKDKKNERKFKKSAKNIQKIIGINHPNLITALTIVDITVDPLMLEILLYDEKIRIENKLSNMESCSNSLSSLNCDVEKFKKDAPLLYKHTKEKDINNFKNIKNKKLLRCKRLANAKYNESFEEALVDPSKWKLGGYASVEHYAKKRKEGIFSICIGK